MTNKQAYQKLIDSIRGGKLVAVGAQSGIGLLTFSTQLAIDVAQQRGLEIWFETRNSFLTKALQNHFSEEKMTVTHRAPPAFFAGVRVIDFSVFGNCKPHLLIPAIKTVADHNNTPTICCIPLKQRWLRHHPRLSDFKFKKEKESVDIAILLHRKPYITDESDNYTTEVTVINKGKQKYTFGIVLTSRGILFPKGKADSYVD